MQAWSITGEENNRRGKAVIAVVMVSMNARKKNYCS
jgi:hypothetical protein